VFSNKVYVFSSITKNVQLSWYCVFWLSNGSLYNIMSDSPLNLVLLRNYKLETSNCIWPIKLNYYT